MKRDPLFRAVDTAWYDKPEFTISRCGRAARPWALRGPRSAEGRSDGPPRGDAPDAGAYQRGPAASGSARRNKASKINGVQNGFR